MNEKINHVQYIHPETYDIPFEKGFDYIKSGNKTLEELQERNERPDDNLKR